MWFWYGFSKGQRGCNDIKIVYISIFSQIRSEGGGHQISFFSQIQNSPHYPRGGGGKKNYGLFPQFVRFFLECSPYDKSSHHFEKLDGTMNIWNRKFIMNWRRCRSLKWDTENWLTPAQVSKVSNSGLFGKGTTKMMTVWISGNSRFLGSKSPLEMAQVATE